MKQMLNWLLSHPLTRGLNLDDPRLTELRKKVIRRKPFLLRIYQDWYQWIASRLPVGDGKVVELGSGAGFLMETIPDLIASEIFLCPGLDLVMDGQNMAFASGSLRAVVFTDVLHHLPDAPLFFRETARCVRPGGRIIMIEPWVSQWSRWIYQHLHHERFDPEAVSWEFPTSGPLSGSNQALPWIIFVRDRARFEREFTEWRIDEIKPGIPLRYLVSGGLTTRSLMPAWSYGFWSWLEKWMPTSPMFASIVLERTS
jgi:SAM-dependent methyltransferase